MGLPLPPPSPVSIMAAPARRPSPRAKLLWAITPALGWATVLIADLVWFALDDRRHAAQGVALVLAVVAGACHVVAVPLWRYAVHRWEITGTAVYVRTGWFTQESRVAPLSRVQTVDTHRGPLERLLGLATVTVTTASSAGAVRITALDLPVAEQTAAQLTAIAATDPGDAT
ncbi:PH domain-containing protein [Nocardia sp. alder85J]|uniref:PH domain-containing protein n=1 Tax=Nocardia sp. alder85J TaxID=2862949 RepID=UPI001CD404E5|nr:PH domain-containing protein [Nocardia sp. alder85J]MCX4096061.1 PH domain-containing protein [Nocardia sp. alder85J]